MPPAPPCLTISGIGRIHANDRRRALGLLTVVLLLAVVCAACASKNRSNPDPRAYPESEPDISLSQALQDHRLRLPEGVANVRFGAYNPRNYGLYLRFDISCSSVSAFLNGSEIKSELTPNNIPSAVASIGKRYDWAVDTYSHPRGAEDVLGSVDRSLLVVDRGAQECRVFVVSYI
jgi:hypothetical protein